jgi:hypothetical protein
MPKGLPSAESLSSRQVGAFSLDTSVVEAAGFRFKEGSLKHLASQIPPWMKLVMSNVVCREIIARRVANIHRAEQQITSGYQDLLRHGGAILSGPAPIYLADVVDRAAQSFDQELSRYISLFDGMQLDLNCEGVLTEMFSRYFGERVPFGGGRDKKHEFPDAAALLSLEKIRSAT